jgi:hypothetical protein
MQPTNPYAPPTPIDAPHAYGGYAGDVPPTVVEHLRVTRPWVLFLGIVGFIVAGFAVIGGLSLMALSGEGASQAFAGSPIGGMGLGFGYVVFAIVYIFPSLFLYRFGSAIGRLVAGGGLPALEEALGQQKSFWRFMGIFTIVAMVLYFVAVVVVVAVGISGVLP